MCLFCPLLFWYSAYVASNNTVRTVTYNDWWTRNGVVSKTVTIMVTPKVVVSDYKGNLLGVLCLDTIMIIIIINYQQETGRQHFNCSTLEGVQLEDQGGSGTALSHWETRILEVNIVQVPNFRGMRIFIMIN